MKSKSKDIIILLGAGASVQAGVPSSPMMIGSIEKLLETKKEWSPYCNLYHQIKAAIYYSAGIKGRFNANVMYNIETLVNTLHELERNEDHPIYPFIAAWNSRLIAHSGPDFRRVREFRDRIIEALQSWVQPENLDDAEYYSGLKRLQHDFQFPLRVFSLNYDLCVERLGEEKFRVETGFAGVGSRHRWEWKRFDETNPEAEPPEIYLYKMHGSINWKRDENADLISVNYSGSNIRPDEMQVIFGRDFKMEAADPYLFYAFEFRRCSLEARAIVTIGYGFGDEHINKMLIQALRGEPSKRLIVVGNVSDTAKTEARKKEIAAKLQVPAERVSSTIAVLQGTAKDFLKRADIADIVSGFLPPDTRVEF